MTHSPPVPDDPIEPSAPTPPRPALLAAIGGVVALVAVAAVMVATSSGGGGGGDDEAEAGSGLGGALATAPTAPANAGTVRDGTSPETTAGPARPPSAASLPPVTIPAEASPPTTIPGSEPSSVPVDILSGEEAPLFGHLVVDLEPGGHQDFAVHLRADQELQLLSLADDGISTEIEVFAPDGTSEGWWEGGEPGVVNGLEWYAPDEPLPATGTYVIRVVHVGGSHETFALGFFGDA
ncbi:MAG TPA: hypothetical protein VFZ77_23435 [Acidimicrobiales bacterium]